MSGWSVEFLNETAEAEFDAFPPDIKAKIAHISKLIEEVGLQNVGGPYVKHVQGKIWEIRASQGRCLYVTARIKKVIILRSFIKKSQKLPKKELEIAKIRAQEVQNG
jgi:phage-related protein